MRPSKSLKSPPHRSQQPPSRRGPHRPMPIKKEKEKEKGGRCARFLASLFLSFLIILGAGFFLPSNIQPMTYDLLPPPQFVGPLSQNDHLKSTERMFEFLIRGPESIAIHDDVIYTGTLNGKIMKIDKDGSMTLFAKLGKVNCSTFPTCGRPFGIRVEPKKKYIYVADGYLGLHRVEIATGKLEKVFPVNKDFRVTFFNDFDFLSNGDIVLSEASTRFHFHDLMNEILESRNNGQLLVINPVSGTFEILKSGLYFPNGVQIDLLSGGDAVLVAESWRHRILRVQLNGSKRGEVSVFADNLPGMPDNIRATEAGDGYWVAMAGVRAFGYQGPTDRFTSWPGARSFMSKMVPSALLHHYGRTRYGLALKLDLQGQIVASLHDSNGSVVRDISQVTEHGGTLYLGNYDSHYLGRLDQSCKSAQTCRFQRNPEAH